MNAPNFELPASSPESSSRPRVLLVDDNKAFRLAALELLKDMDEIEVCGEAQDAASAMEQVRALHPTLVITDITLPDEDGLYIANRTRELSPQTIVLILSMHDELLFGIRALKVGASGYVHKEEAASQLAPAVRQVLAGNYFLSPKLLEHVVHITRHSAPAAGTWTDVRALERLTDREMEVFHWLGQGLGSSQIARQLRLGLKTIETHRASIKRKLEAGSSAAMVQLAMQWREIENKSASAHFWMKN